MVAFVDASSGDAFRDAVRAHYQQATGIQAEIYEVEAAAGACIFEP